MNDQQERALRHNETYGASGTSCVNSLTNTMLKFLPALAE